MVRVPQGEFPHSFSGRLPRLANLLLERIVVPEHSAGLVSEGYAACAGQRRNIDDHRGLVPAGIGKGVGENEPAFRVGVEDLYGLARQGPEHVAGLVRAAARHVFRCRQQSHDVERKLELRGRPKGAEHRRASRHIVLHLVHVLCGLDRDAAGIEGNGLAHERDKGLLPSAPVFDDDELRRLCAARGHAEERPHPELPHLRPLEDLDLHPVALPDLLRLCGDDRGRHVRRGMAHHVPRHDGGSGDDLPCLRALLHGRA